MVQVCYLIGDYHFKCMRFAQAQEHIRDCLAFLAGFGLFPTRRCTSSAVESAVESGADLPGSAAPLVAFEVEGCNLVENSTRPDPTVNNFNPTRQEPDYFEPDPTRT